MRSRRAIEHEIDENGCFVCTSHSPHRGYHQLKRNGRVQMMHRWIYEQIYGVVPDSAVVHHICGNTLCINPLHLTVKDRSLHIGDHRRGIPGNKGELNAASKLTDVDVMAIRQDREHSNTWWSKKYGVSQTVVSSVRLGKTWKHLLSGGK